MLVIGVLTAGLFYVWWVSKYQPRQEEIVELTSRQAELQAATAELRRILAETNTERIRQSIQQYDQQLSQVTQLVPPDSFNVQMLPLVTQTANQYDVQIQSINPIQQKKQQGFLTDGAQITVIGQYHNVGAFITALLNLEHITQIQNASLQVADRQGGGQGQQGAGGRNRRREQSQSQSLPQSSGSALTALRQTRTVRVVFDFLLFKTPPNQPAQSDSAQAGNNQAGNNQSGSGSGSGGSS